MGSKKQANVETFEGELTHDIFIRADRLFKHVRRRIGNEIDPETGRKWQEAYEKMIIKNAEFLEEMAMELEMPDQYTDSKYITVVKQKHLP